MGWLSFLASPSPSLLHMAFVHVCNITKIVIIIIVIFTYLMVSWNNSTTIEYPSLLSHISYEDWFATTHCWYFTYTSSNYGSSLLLQSFRTLTAYIGSLKERQSQKQERHKDYPGKPSRGIKPNKLPQYRLSNQEQCFSPIAN